jgi:hypothetical protein
MTGRHGRLMLLWGWGAVVTLVAARTHAHRLELIENTIVEQQALTFADCSATRFANTVNGRTHQQTPLTTYRGYQYVTYYDADRRVCLGRRKLPHGAWQVIRFEDHRIKSNDSHNTAVVGVCDTDGTIHLAFDHHATQLNYRVSKRGAAHDPELVKWEAGLFGPVTHTLGTVVPDKQVTYPRFFAAPGGNLMLYYRAVTSGNGDGMIEQYDGNRHDWTPGLGKFIARDIGTFTANGAKSLYRCPYMNSLSFAGQRLHASWVWRDRFDKTNPRNQHDLCYAYSDDAGRSWCNSVGELIGKTGTDFIHLDSPGLVVARIPCRAALTNQNTHYAFPDGSIHIVLRHRLQGTWNSQYHHYWRTSQGIWRLEPLPFTGDRPKLIGTKDGDLILVYTDEERLFVACGQLNRQQSRWHWKDIQLPSPHSIYGDAVLDLQRWEDQQVLSIYSQDEPAKQIRSEGPGPVDGWPSPLRVVDYRLLDHQPTSQPTSQQVPTE